MVVVVAVEGHLAADSSHTQSLLAGLDFFVRETVD